MSDLEVREVYRGLINIEDTFKISKTEFDSRPVFLRTNDHIDAHFTTCFTSLVLLRLLQTKLENKYPVGKIIDSLKSYCCVPLDKNTHKIGPESTACEYRRQLEPEQQIYELAQYAEFDS